MLCGKWWITATIQWDICAVEYYATSLSSWIYHEMLLKWEHNWGKTPCWVREKSGCSWWKKRRGRRSHYSFVVDLNAFILFILRGNKQAKNCMYTQSIWLCKCHICTTDNTLRVWKHCKYLPSKERNMCLKVIYNVTLTNTNLWGPAGLFFGSLCHSVV